MKKIQILLSSYNGETYIREQLDSFVALDNFHEVKVLIRDDGSRDGTPAILEEYKEKYGFEIVYGENVGLDKSLSILFSMADADCLYYAYSDQDDVWKHDKLSRAVKALDEAGEDCPVMYAALSHLTDAKGNIIGVTRTPTKPPSFYNAMVQNICPGHTQVYSRPMLELLKKNFSEGIFVMDHWAYIFATAFGKVIFDAVPTTLYRQHGKNAIGYGATFGEVMRNRLRRVKQGAAVQHTVQMTAFMACAGDLLDDQKKKEVVRFLESGKHFFSRLRYSFTARAYRQTLVENFCFRLLYFLGGYRTNKRKDTKQ